jgi:hypothetical protein
VRDRSGTETQGVGFATIVATLAAEADSRQLVPSSFGG